ncbi:TRAP transporter permease [Ferviditalea candida]|uniref:TRAP transporter permease n=1 Tax=Ferviditalea candida TaxID=3108399 RepID=A0ABU5ZKD2_9BACL|nr:TRAP transporter permease [Paenibacillaceae bacterium T2]
MNNSVDETSVLEKYDRESVTRTSLKKPVLIIISVLAIALTLFHLYTSFVGPLVNIKQRSIHLYTLMTIAFLLYPFSKKSRRDRLPLYDIITAAISFGLGIYMFVTADRIVNDGGAINNLDFAVGILVILFVIDATRRVTGWGMPILAIAFLIYGIYAKLSVYPKLNGIILLNNLKAMTSHLVYITEGILGEAIGVSASYIILFILFGAFLEKSGMGRLFNDLALAMAGSAKGGPAKVAVLASAFLGSINGSAVANVVTTGAFTIPLMKKVGYHKNFAGAVESAASVGGQILPPIMGAAAFIMAENLSVPYTKIILAGIIPALLYYLGVLLQVHFRAGKQDLTGIPKSELPSVKEVIAQRGHLLVPMMILLYLLFSGRTPFFAAFWSIMATIIISGSIKLLQYIIPVLLLLVFRDPVWAFVTGGPAASANTDWMTILVIIAVPLLINLLRRKLRIPVTEEVGFKEFKAALEGGAKTTISVAMACAAVGIIVGIATLTGVALNVANGIVALGSHVASPLLQLLITLSFTMIASIVLGMGLPSIPTYIITSTMAAPILLQTPLFTQLAGNSDNAIFIAHMFVFYFGIFANITPPVALAAFAGAGISGGDPNKTGFQAVRLAVAGFIVPFMFVFAPSMLMIDTNIAHIVMIVVTSVLGVFLLAIAMEGFFRERLSIPLRGVSFASALLLIYPGLITSLIGFVGFVIVLLLNKRQANGKLLENRVAHH